MTKRDYIVPLCYYIVTVILTDQERVQQESALFLPCGETEESEPLSR